MPTEKQLKYWQSITGRKLSEEHKDKISKALKGISKPEGFNIGRKLSEETIKKLRESNLGQKRSEETKRKMKDNYNYHTNNGCFEKGQKPWNTGIKSWVSGDKHPNWKGGITEEQQRARNSDEYAKWRIEVLRNNDFTCQRCGVRGGKLIAHHLKSFATFLKLRFDIDNGQTLCRKCHYETHYSNNKIGSLNTQT